MAQVSSLSRMRAGRTQSRMGADVHDAVDAALISFIRQRVDELLATLDGKALRRARRASEWDRVEVYAHDSNAPR